MKAVYTWPDNLATLYIDPDYLGSGYGGFPGDVPISSTSGYVTRMREALDGYYGAWSVDPFKIFGGSTSTSLLSVSELIKIHSRWSGKMQVNQNPSNAQLSSRTWWDSQHEFHTMRPKQVSVTSAFAYAIDDGGLGDGPGILLNSQAHQFTRWRPCRTC